MSNFPEFPDFRRVHPEDKELYESFYKKYDPYADLSFSNLLLWLDINDDLEISSIGKEGIVLKYSNPYNFNKESYTLLAYRDCYSLIREIFEYQEARGLKKSLTMTPQVVVDNLRMTASLDKFDIAPEEDNKNYIFDTHTTTLLEGGEYKNLRRKINHFNNHYREDLTIELLDLKVQKNSKLVMDSIEEWLGAPIITAGSAGNSLENEVIKRQILYQNVIPSECLAFYIKKRLQGFTIFHKLPQKDYVIANHIKCNYHFQYMFDFIFFNLCRLCDTRGIKFINGEQDLGILSLRAHKIQHKPFRFLNFYTISSIS